MNQTVELTIKEYVELHGVLGELKGYRAANKVGRDLEPEHLDHTIERLNSVLSSKSPIEDTTQ